MKKGQLIHTDNLILRIIVTFLGTFGAASIIETITYPLEIWDLLDLFH